MTKSKKKNNRDDFSEKTKRTLAQRVGYLCSCPDCRRPTVGPHSSKNKVLLIGVAAHISAAAPRGPRYNLKLNCEKRKDISNGIWLCETHASIIDKDPKRYNENLLHKWKKDAEDYALQELELFKNQKGTNVSDKYTLDDLKVVKVIETYQKKLQDYTDVLEYEKAKDLANEIALYIDNEITNPGRNIPEKTLGSIYLQLAEMEMVLDDKTGDYSKFKYYLQKSSQLKNDSQKEINKLEALQIYSHYLENGINSLPEKINPQDSQYIIYINIVYLLRNQKITEACNLIRNIPFQEKWCKVAVMVYIRNKELEKARKIISWTSKLNNKLVYHKCVATYAYFVLFPVENKELLKYKNLKKETKENIKYILEIISPIYEQIRLNKSISNELEAEIVQAFMLIQDLIDNKTKSKEAAKLLLTRTPLPLKFAEAVIRGIVEADDTIICRLRTEHPESLKAQILVCRIEAQCFNKHNEAFDKALTLVEMAKNEDDKNNVLALLIDISHKIGQHKIEEVKNIAAMLTDGKNTFRRLIDADLLIHQNQIDEALNILKENPQENFPYWLSLQAICSLRKGNNLEAYKYYKKIVGITENPDLLKVCAEMALELNNNEAESFLLRLLKYNHYEEDARNKLSYIYVKKSDYSKCLEQFKKLQEINPERIDYKINQAKIYSRISGKNNIALAIYDEIINEKGEILEVILERAFLLKVMGNIDNAFQTLKSVSNKYWQNFHFLTLYIDLAYASGNDENGGEAFTQIRKLKEMGIIDDKYLKDVNLEDIKEFYSNQHEQHKQINQKILNGKLPWPLAEFGLKRVTYAGWEHRTQSLEWIYEEPVNIADHTIYSTNYSHVNINEHGKKILSHYRCPEKGAEIVADISALITLHKLGIIKETTEYFSKIYVPATYFSNSFDEGVYLIPHQLSEKTTSKELLDNIINQKIYVLTDSTEEIAFVNEHRIKCDNARHYYNIIDLVQPLYDNGKIDENVYTNIINANLKSSAADNNYSELQLDQKLICEYSTLLTIIRLKILDTVVEQFNVYVTSDNADEIRRAVKVFEAQEKIKQQHNDLWATLRNNNSFIQVVDESRAFTSEERNKTSLAAYDYATKKHLSFYVDDRAFQEVFINDKANTDSESFGTDVFIQALLKANLISIEQASDMFMQLIKWRYKFIVLNSDVLKGFCDRYSGHPPGDSLKKVACYLHNCMRDPGFSTNFYDTEPPRTYASEFSSQWIVSAIEFIAKVWKDNKYDDEAAETLTKWALYNLLPSEAENFDLLFQSTIANFRSRLVISQALLLCSQHLEINRANKVLHIIKKNLNIDDEKYSEIICKAINDIPLNEETQKAKSLLVYIAFKSDAKHDIRTISELINCNVFKKNSDYDIEKHYLDILQKHNHKDRDNSVMGPLCIFKEKEQYKIIDATILLFSDSLTTRKAALNHFEYLISERLNYLTESSIKLLEEQSENIKNTNDKKWRVAARVLFDKLSDDFFLNLAGFAQSFHINELESTNRFFTKIFKPDIKSLSCVVFPIVSPTNEYTIIKKKFASILENLESFDDACNNYLSSFGYLPLYGECSFVSFLNCWINKHESKANICMMLWEWAKNKKNVLAYFHSCTYFIVHSSNIPEEIQKPIWDKIEEFISFDLSSDKDSDIYTQMDARTLLAQYYVYYLSIIYPGGDGDKISAISWWLTDKIISIMEVDKERYMQFKNNFLIPNLNHVHYLYRLVNPKLNYSHFTFATLYVRSLWSLAILRYIMETGTYSNVLENHPDKLLKSLVTHSVAWGGIPEDKTESRIYAFDFDIISNARNVEFDEKNKKNLHVILDCYTKIQTKKCFAKMLKNLSTLNKDDQTLVCQTLFNQSCLKGSYDDEIWQCLTDFEWANEVFKTLESTTLYLFIQGLLHIQAYTNNEKFKYSLPHILADQCIENNNNLERQKELFNYVILSCISSNTTSALVKLRKKSINTLTKEQSSWKERLQDLIQYSSPWVGSRLRGILPFLD